MTTSKMLFQVLDSGWRLRRVVAAIVVICGSGCDFPGRPRASEQSQAARDQQSFTILYRRNCAGCHGAEGSSGPAPPLSDKLFADLIPEAELSRVISDGRSGTLMPAFGARAGGHLAAEQVSALAQGIKSHWGSGAPVPAEIPPYLAKTDERALKGNMEAGSRAFARACASCHGEDGQGADGAGAIHVPEVVGLLSDQALRRLIITGRDDLGMPGSNDGKGRAQGFKPLTSREVAEIVSLLASWREAEGATVTAKGN